ncbi:hypothetical protein AciPR4_2864 [Terriglobus saanensis SP1PR4]|uniref:Uncharacterized protein n=1 Tax=Terriglobus saanensis (strain ATCC BAA-1853 / DSM 23119 / SP1PR4) TaxID=401053 RepID=E8V483_TERSS|nr:hypothetical protein AciPR4_2864 [Terriglobus saanensis SP1PR4]
MEYLIIRPTDGTSGCSTSRTIHGPEMGHWFLDCRRNN